MVIYIYGCNIHILIIISEFVVWVDQRHHVTRAYMSVLYDIWHVCHMIYGMCVT